MRVSVILYSQVQLDYKNIEVYVCSKDDVFLEINV